MINVGGFPEKFEFSPIPKPFITSMLDNMESIDELKVILKAFNAIYQKKGFLKYCEISEISQKEDFESTKTILDDAIKNNILISCDINQNNMIRTLYLVNDKHGNDCLAKIKKSYVSPISEEETKVDKEHHHNIYSLYENNIGQLTPIIIEELKIAENDYPEQWIEEAFKEAVQLNKRNWKYIKAILMNWQTEGKKDGNNWRNNETDSSRFNDGPYAHLIKH